MARSPDIPAFATVKQGQVFKLECVGTSAVCEAHTFSQQHDIDWTGAQIGNNDSE